MTAPAIGVGECRVTEARTPAQGVLAGQQAEQGQRSEDDGRDKPRCVRILAITVGSTMAAMIFKVPPHWKHCSISISNTRLSNRAQLMRAGAEGWGASA